MPRYFVTGTDTDVGKTRVTAALAAALRHRGAPTTVVKLVQTGLPPRVPGDAVRAGTLAGVDYLEFVRFAKPADPWSAALAQAAAPPRAANLVYALDAVPGSVVVEGAGGLMVPLNADEHFGHVIAMAGLKTVVAIGVRLGCLNHALLTIEACRHHRIALAGGVLVERWGPVAQAERDDVARVLQGKLRLFGTLPFEPDEARSVAEGAAMFADLVQS
ncbi:MAG: dethiobiotin synthase [Candidatus Eremiobacteraeota bacterium]|nr:dethiobiotin synthase [Candidatus Eremiobacteraeota bacterium]